MRRLHPLLLALLLAAPAAMGYASRMDPVRNVVAVKGEDIGATEKPRTKQKRAVLSTLRRLERPLEDLDDDLGAARKVFRVLDRAFPGDPDIDPILAIVLDQLLSDALGERASLLAWFGRTGSDRGQAILERGLLQADRWFTRASAETRRHARAGLLRKGVRIVRKTRRKLDLDAPRAGPPPFEGPAPDFALEDVNPGSATAGSDVSPRDYEGMISAWYFTHTT